MSYYRAKVYRFIVQFVKDHALAEDLTQDIMLKMWSKYERLSTLEDIDNYILKMSKHHVIDHFKKLAREKAYQEQVWRHMQKSVNTVENKLADKDIDAHLDAIIKSLPLRQREVYTLNKQEGLSLHEIASTLGITTRTARNHLDRALKVIRDNMNTDSLLFWIVSGAGYVTIIINQ
ncbi:MAG TPA: sigma-70 family RNA polymerase sigma factor [Agriterribacter sp.]|nr:sigma-70 family RNA polymerase sigma factor [Agriterribacter sp.]